MDKNYYEILGVNKNASKEEISKNFKKLSLKWHPDKWVTGTEEEKKAAEEKFKEISEAYSVLSDEQKRQEYDMGGSNPFGEGFNPFEGFNFHFGGNFHQNQPRGPMPIKGEDCRATIEITLEESFNGCEKEISYTKKKTCSHCNGTGSEDKKTTVCPHCNGTGTVTTSQHRGNMFFQQTSTCPLCNGLGYINTKPCKKCGGSGFEDETITEKIAIPKGIQDGMTITYHGKGSPGKNGGANGNLLININIKNTGSFVRIEDNLVYYDNVPISSALLGYEKTIECLDGTHIKVKVPELTKDNASFVYKGKGMPKLDAFGRNIGYGDLAFVVQYVYPKKLTKKHKELLKEWEEIQ